MKNFKERTLAFIITSVILVIIASLAVLIFKTASVGLELLLLSIFRADKNLIREIFSTWTEAISFWGIVGEGILALALFLLLYRFFNGRKLEAACLMGGLMIIILAMDVLTSMYLHDEIYLIMQAFVSFIALKIYARIKKFCAELKEIDERQRKEYDELMKKVRQQQKSHKQHTV